MPDFTVRKYDIDSSGRPIYMTTFMADWWKQVTDELGFVPTIVQGAFMARAGGGATASAGYHDAAGCLDLRTWDRTPQEVERMVRVLREHGAAAWVRDARHGMDPHLHLVLGADYPLAAGAAQQWRDYLAGLDGLASRGRDYHWRPDPIVTEPPEVDPMSAYEDNLKRIESKLDALLKQEKGERVRDKAEFDRDRADRQREQKRFQRLMEAVKAGQMTPEAAAYEAANPK